MVELVIINLILKPENKKQNSYQKGPSISFLLKYVIFAFVSSFCCFPGHRSCPSQSAVTHMFTIRYIHRKRESTRPSLIWSRCFKGGCNEAGRQIRRRSSEWSHSRDYLQRLSLSSPLSEILSQVVLWIKGCQLKKKINHETTSFFGVSLPGLLFDLAVI